MTPEFSAHVATIRDALQAGAAPQSTTADCIARARAALDALVASLTRDQLRAHGTPEGAAAADALPDGEFGATTTALAERARPVLAALGQAYAAADNLGIAYRQAPEDRLEEPSDAVRAAERAYFRSQAHLIAALLASDALAPAWTLDVDDSDTARIGCWFASFPLSIVLRRAGKESLHADMDRFIDQALVREGAEPCKDAGRCHGPLKWCDACGDVKRVCDAAPGDCDAHPPEASP